MEKARTFLEKGVEKARALISAFGEITVTKTKKSRRNRKDRIFEGRYLGGRSALRDGTARRNFAKMNYPRVHAVATPVRDRKRHFPGYECSVLNEDI